MIDDSMLRVEVNQNGVDSLYFFEIANNKLIITNSLTKQQIDIAQYKGILELRDYLNFLTGKRV